MVGSRKYTNIALMCPKVQGTEGGIMAICPTIILQKREGSSLVDLLCPPGRRYDVGESTLSSSSRLWNRHYANVR